MFRRIHWHASCFVDLVALIGIHDASSVQFCHQVVTAWLGITMPSSYEHMLPLYEVTLSVPQQCVNRGTENDHRVWWDSSCIALTGFIFVLSVTKPSFYGFHTNTAMVYGVNVATHCSGTLFRTLPTTMVWIMRPEFVHCNRMQALSVPSWWQGYSYGLLFRNNLLLLCIGKSVAQFCQSVTWHSSPLFKVALLLSILMWYWENKSILEDLCLLLRACICS